MATQIKIRRDTASNWTSNNPTLSLGEIAYETDTLKIKFGNGSSNWAALSYATQGSGGGLTLASFAISTGSATGGGSLSYNNSTGLFTFRPADLSSYLTGITGAQVTTALGYTPITRASLSVTSASANSQFSTLSYSNTTGIFSFTPFQLAAATTSTLGGVKIDGTTITINNGVITAVGGGGGGGSGSVNSGLGTSLAYYPATGTTVDDASNAFWNNSTNTLTVVGTVAATTLTGAISSSQVTTALGYTPTQLASFTTATGTPSAFYSGLSYDTGSGLFTYTPFSLAIADVSVLGGVKVGTGLSISGSGVLSLNTATASDIGGVKVGTGLSIDGSGILSSTITQYTLPTAAAGTLGGVKVGTGLSIDGSGILSSTITQYTLPTATTSVLGGVKVDGSTITITVGGVLSAVAPSLAGTALTGTQLATGITQSSLTSVGTLTNLTVGGLLSIAETSRVLTSLSGATGTIAHDFSLSDVFYHSSAVANWTTNITNVPTTNNREMRVKIIMNQGVSAYIPSGYQIDGAAQTILWENGTAPTVGTANKIDIIELTLIRRASAWLVLGSYSLGYN
jgi:hypothetical protein